MTLRLSYVGGSLNVSPNIVRSLLKMAPKGIAVGVRGGVLAVILTFCLSGVAFRGENRSWGVFGGLWGAASRRSSSAALIADRRVLVSLLVCYPGVRSDRRSSLPGDFILT